MILLNFTGSNFVKAFKEFGFVSEEEIGETDEVDSEDCLLKPDTILESTEENPICLPFHLRCASHTISLISTTDSKKVPKQYIHQQNKPFGKCAALWNLSRRPKSSEIIQNTIGCALKLPVVTRWNSFYDALQLILKHKETINKCMTQLKLPLFSEVDFEVMDEYVLVLAPISIGLDYLQRDKESMYGIFLPTLLAIEQKLNTINRHNLKHSQALLDAIIKGFSSRFSNYLELEDTEEVNFAILAAVSHPQYKIMWLKMKDTLNTDTVKLYSIFL